MKRFNRRARRALSGPFYHGGAPDLTEVLPPSVSRTTDTLLDYGSIGDATKVYVTNDLPSARTFALCHPSGRGTVYRVRPVGCLLPDPDCKRTGISWSCDKAIVLEVIS